MQKCLLGIDGGGSKTLALITDLEGNLLGQGKAGGSGYKSVGKETCIKSLKEAIGKAIKSAGQAVEVKAACFGMADYDTPHDRQEYLDILTKNDFGIDLPQNAFSIYNDTRIALAAGTDKNYGIVFIAGTGSNCYGINRQGKETRCGGMDWLLSDEGSAYDLTIKALKAILWEYDGRGEKTLLKPLFLEKLNKSCVLELLDWVYAEEFSKRRFAALAPLVDQAYKQGDKVAAQIVDEAIQGLVLMGKTVVEKLKMEDEKFDFVLCGGVFKIGQSLIDKLANELKKTAPRASFKRLEKDSAWGAIKLAKDLINEKEQERSKN